jgi:endothelin-converting enzyme/putative endopeptidase
MDEAAIEARGTAPLKPYLDAIAAVKDRGELVDLFASVGYDSPVALQIFADLATPDRYAVYATQSGLGMPNRDYYLLQGAKYDAYRAAYRAYVTKVQQLPESPMPRPRRTGSSPSKPPSPGSTGPLSRAAKSRRSTIR